MKKLECMVRALVAIGFLLVVMWFIWGGTDALYRRWEDRTVYAQDTVVIQETVAKMPKGSVLGILIVGTIIAYSVAMKIVDGIFGLW